MQIIDGYCNTPNIYADDIGEYNISLYGNGDYVLPVGEQLGYELVSNNEIKVKDGFFITQGRRGCIKKGTTESCVIENGTQAENRNDLIVIEYAKNESTMVESHTLKVIKGTPGQTAADPTTVTGNIPNGAVLHQMPLYRVKLEGLNVVAVEKLFEIGKISPETVDPMLATEEGFAADAAKTKALFDEVNSKMVRYNSDTDTLQVFYGGSWVDIINAGLQEFDFIKTSLSEWEISSGYGGAMVINSTNIKLSTTTAQSGAATYFTYSKAVAGMEGKLLSLQAVATGTNPQYQRLEVGYSINNVDWVTLLTVMGTTLNGSANIPWDGAAHIRLKVVSNSNVASSITISELKIV